MDLGIFQNAPWGEMGLPSINGSGPTCSGLPGTRACTADDIIEKINSRPPVYSPYAAGPIYSNIAFALLGMVIEAATGQPFQDVARDNIFNPAGMESTSFFGFDQDSEDSLFVPIGDPTWNITAGVFEASGGMFSTSKDLISFAEAIYGNRLLSPRATRQWMKPETHTSSWGYSVGAPWEILRTDNITADGRLIDVYTKSGDLGLYHAYMAIVPDYDISISVITAGAEVSFDPYSRSRFLSAVVRALIPAVEQAGREENTMVGTYFQESTNSTLEITMDDGPGLVISSFSVRGFDVLNNINSYSINTASAGEGAARPPAQTVQGRLYPTKHDAEGETWRAAFTTTTAQQREALDADLFAKDGSCEMWFGFDRSAYNFQSLAEFVVVQDGDTGYIRNAAFNVSMAKVSGTNEPSDVNGPAMDEPSGANAKGRAMGVVMGALLMCAALG
ncbi:beta-lactamase/transpeptidase-like protein [Stachybotrys elegans]|uniref:Beta-lactamase/transpeptidase-like protein n=1 Tax=Stachybotrys elegans TaxID=80388 RepID=A0A8K0WVN0_9HYPO|nr:beta-lactamase/transpeptidase-like protein [Stachybotrys elegans]